MSTPDAQDKKVPQFSSFTMRPATAPAESCCTDHACATESAPAAEALSDARYRWQVDGMDCAACARKVETAVRQVPGVSQVQVLFATEKLLVNAEGDVRAQVENAVRQAGYTLRDADAPAAEQTRGSLLRDNLPLLTLVIMMALSWGLEQANHPAGQLAFIATTLVGLWPVARQALRLIKSGSWFAIETLMSVAAIGALFIGATAEAAMVLLLFLIGERLEGWAASRARQGVSALMALKPDTAIRLRNGVRETVAQRDLRPGDVIEVAAGGRLPADGQLLSPFASFDESALTGESVPVERQAGERVAAGATSVDRLVQLTVISEPGDSAIDRILKLIEEAEERRAPIERFIDRFSRIYTPAIMVVALLVAIVPPLFFASAWLPWIYKGLTLLLIGCPCALVISTPAAITSGLAVAARRGALIKGGAALEQLGQVRQVAFDKTGTLTVGQPQVTSVIATAEVDDNALLALAAAVEQGSSHPLAQAIVREAQRRQLSIPLASGQRALAGSGIEAEVNGSRILICAASKAAPAEHEAQIQQLESAGQTVVLVMRGETLLGILALRDTLRDDARQAVDALHQLGVQGVILTGMPSPANWGWNSAPVCFNAVIALNADAPLEWSGTVSTRHHRHRHGQRNRRGAGDGRRRRWYRLTGFGADDFPGARHRRQYPPANCRDCLAGLKGDFPRHHPVLGLTGLWLAVLADTGDAPCWVTEPPAKPPRQSMRRRSSSWKAPGKR